MSLAGRTLGHYVVSTLIGRGGMGEVYRAKDQKLGRDVAIKVLPEEFARDLDRVARFQREAKLLASLNHPSIAAIYGLEESGGIQFLVLELVEGETIADQLKRGPIPVEESLMLALQTAEALEAAHEKGVIHRDLKPANIKVTPEGKVKVLDFGLAKAFAGEQVDLNLSNSPTLSNLATQQGIILGTAAYMSPEQARGKSVDKRTDIWAFGCVLYEMLTGHAAFQGEDLTEILASVVKGGANLDLLPASIHPRVREVLIRCLQKDLKRRYPDIADARYEIEQCLADPTGILMRPLATVESRLDLRRILPWAAAAIVLTAVIAGVAGWSLKRPEPRHVTRFYYDLPKGQQFGDLYERGLAVSPDGRQFVYSTKEGLYLRSLDDMNAILLPGTGGDQQRPFFSRDGKWIGFFSWTDKKLKKITIGGGAPVALADVSPFGSFDLSADDGIVYCQTGYGGIMQVPANGGKPQAIVKSTDEGIAHPQILPDGKSILFTRTSSTPEKIIVQLLKSGERKELFEGDCARYLPSGHIVYAQGNNLLAVPFNLSKFEVAGSAVSMVEGVARAGGAPQYSVSESGTLIYVPGTRSGATFEQRTLVWVDRNGKEEPLGAPASFYQSIRISPDGTKVALHFETADNIDIRIWDLVRKNLSRLTFHEAIDVVPLWTRDGKRIVFGSSRKEGNGVYWKAADGTGNDEFLGPVPSKEVFPSSCSRDGKTLVLTTEGSNSDIGTLLLESDRKYRPLLQEKYHEVQPQISPDGRWMAYTSNESGQDEIYVRPFPEVEKGRWQVSTSGGDIPLWSRDGRELFYRSGDAVMAVSVKTEPTFSPETPKILFRGRYVSSSTSAGHPADTPWDISPDGKRFLMMKELRNETEAGAPQRINIVLNWFEELKQRVPVK